MMIKSISDPNIKIQICVHGFSFDIRPAPRSRFTSEKRDTARDWARSKAKKILDTHYPQPLEPEMKFELQRIIQSVENS